MDMPQRKKADPIPLPLEQFVHGHMRDPQPWVEHYVAFKHCSAGLYIGRMTPEPKAGEFGAVLSVGAEPGTVDDSVRHRHLPLSYQAMDRAQLKVAVDWVLNQYELNRTVLVRSEDGRQRPALVVAAVFLRLGATYFDAMLCVEQGNPDALSDFRYRNILRELEGR